MLYNEFYHVLVFDMSEKAFVLMADWSLPELTVGINNQIEAKMQTSALLANTVGICSDYAEQHGQTLILGSYSLCKTDDSGYHTSLTPGSLGCTEISEEYLDHSVLSNKTCGAGHYIPSEVNLLYNRPIKIQKETIDTPLLRPGVKRSYQKSESSDFSYSPIPTPTSLIAGKIQSLDVNENKENACRSINEKVSEYSSIRKYRYYEYESSSYPITPVKKNCKLNPCRKSAKKLSFVTHSLSCEPQELQLATKKRSQVTSVRTVLFQPEKKLDILRLLYKNGNAMPPISTIFNYLSNEDVYNFKLVSATWAEIWESVGDKKRKREYEDYIKSIRENQENRNKKGREIQLKNKMRIGCFREIHNELYHSSVCTTPTSPPSTPKSERFKKFTKAASLDSRVQLECTRCTQPAKVTTETSGEEWVECTNLKCLHQFCRFCRCERHPGRKCFLYDLNGPSPSKRKKTEFAIGTKKSRKNLRRLL